MNKKILYSIIGLVLVGGLFSLVYAGPIITMITFAGNTLTTGSGQVDGDLNIDGSLSGQTIDAINDKITSLQLMFFKSVVVANSGDDDISVLLGNSDGTFARTDVAVGNGPLSVAIGDLNNDGNQDVVVANRDSGDISVLLGNGDGTFARTDVAVGIAPFSVAIGKSACCL